MKANQGLMRVRGSLFAFRVRLWGGTAGTGIMLDKRVTLRHQPGRNWTIGSNVYIGVGAIIDIWPGAELRVGDRTKIMQYTSIAARESVTIGKHSQIAEFTSIRDANHGIDQAELITLAPMNSSPVHVGENVWVGRGCAILAGSGLGDGVVVGANSVVLSAFEADLVIAGVPARIIRARRTGG